MTDVQRALHAATDDLPSGLRTLVALRIAHFLRALPAEFIATVVFDSGNEDDVLFCEDWELLARAVEAAAEGDNPTTSPPP